MLRIKLLRNLLILALGIAILLPSYEFLFVHPAYHELLTAETELDAVRYANFLVRSLGLEDQTLTKSSLPKDFREKLQLLSGDSLLIKMRIFSADGEIIHSSDTAEIGEVNRKDYFLNIVKQGHVYSKVVQKDRKTADGVVARIDVVETYVPFMAAGRFVGAIEVYYDITSSVDRIKSLTRQSVTTTILMALGFLLAILAALSRAYATLQQRDRAENALRQANEALELRVAERTEELSETNEQLTNEIAERTLAQMALCEALEDSRADREKLDGILRSVADGLVVTDGDRNILHMNAAAEELLGVALETALNKSLDQLGLKVDFQHQIDSSLRQPRGEQFFDFELGAPGALSPQVFQARLSRLNSDQAGNPGLILLIRDVTREREVERMKSAFLGMAAHELNTPLASILGYSELLTNQEAAGRFTAEQKQEYLTLIHVKSLALARLVDDLLDISRIESGSPLALLYEEFCLDDLLHDVFGPYRQKHERHQFELQVSDGPILLKADAGRVRQVLENLVSNAVKYSPRGGPVSIAAKVTGPVCRILVADQGIGMTAEQVEHVFDRFYRADSSNTAVQGVGLGMSIVRHIVWAHGGTIRVDSEPGAGTSVVVEIPLVPPAQA